MPGHDIFYMQGKQMVIFLARKMLVRKVTIFVTRVTIYAKSKIMPEKP